MGDEVRVVLDSASLARLGIATATLGPVTRPPELEFPALVVEDPGAATIVRSGIAGRLAVAPGAAWPRPGDRLVGGAAVAQVGDARALIVPRGGTVVAVRAQPGELVQPGQVLFELVDYSTALIQVAWEHGTPPLTLGFGRGDGPRRTGERIGLAPEADPLTRWPAWRYRVPDPGLRPGTALSAFQPDPGAPPGGVVVPDAAVVQWDALAWCYVERAAGQFARVPVSTSAPVAGGWLVSRGLRSGERVVVTGAGLLLSEEFRSRIVVGEEVGE